MCSGIAVKLSVIDLLFTDFEKANGCFLYTINQGFKKQCF